MKKHIKKIPDSAIGILSGMGPLAGSDVLRKALAYAAIEYGAIEDADYPDILLVSRGFEGFDAQGTIGPYLEQKLIRAVKELERNGSRAIGLACNTVHVCFDALQASVAVPIVHLPQETAKRASKHQGTFLLLTSHVTRLTGLYHRALDAHGVTYTGLNDQEQQIADEVIGLVMAYRLEEAHSKIRRLVAKHRGSIDGVIAGCTELPLALDGNTAIDNLLYFDSNRVLAAALTDLCYTTAGDPASHSLPSVASTAEHQI